MSIKVTFFLKRFLKAKPRDKLKVNIGYFMTVFSFLRTVPFPPSPLSPL